MIDHHCLETIRRLQLHMTRQGAGADEQSSFFGSISTAINMLTYDDRVPINELPDAVDRLMHDICDLPNYRMPGSAEITTRH